MIPTLKKQSEKIYEYMRKMRGDRPCPADITMKDAFFTDMSYTPKRDVVPVSDDRVLSVRYVVEVETFNERMTFKAQCSDVAIKYPDQPRNMITGIQEVLNCPLGLYRVHWDTGGSSVAAIGNDANGNRWLAPCNWTNGSVKLADHLSSIAGLEPI